MTNIYYLGVHIGHDRGAAIVRDGELIASISEERLDRRKGSNSPEFPMLAIQSVLEISRIQAQDLAIAAVSYTSVRIDAIIDQLADELRDLLGVSALPVVGAGHHECHALSAYFTSGAARAVVIVADGAGDIVGNQIEAESVFEGNGDCLEFRDHRLQDFGMTRTDRRNAFNPAYIHPEDKKKQISLGRKYEQLTYLIGFGHGQAGKTMGLAAYSTPLIPTPLQKENELKFSLTFSDTIDEIYEKQQRSGKPWHRFVGDNRAAIAATAQNLIEQYMIGALCGLYHHFGHKTLCAAGGLFLNCKMNHEILRKTPFDKIFVFPAAGDDGQAAGAAFFASQVEGETRSPRRLHNAFLGPSYDESEIKERIDYFGLYSKHYEQSWLVERIADDLADGRVIGILRGRSEIGPRALGHRSILGDPRRSAMRDQLNKIKGREGFRPFAPIITSEDQFSYFDLQQDSPFMLLATTLREQYRQSLPAIVHADGSSRVQSISVNNDPFIHALLRAFEARTGFPIILNTSFNLADEPIVQSPHDAISTYLRSNIDTLVLENAYITSKVARRWA